MASSIRRLTRYTAQKLTSRNRFLTSKIGRKIEVRSSNELHRSHGLACTDLANHRALFSTSVVKCDQHNAAHTVDSEEVEKFSRIADTWWQTSGEFGALHSMNELRIPLIRDALTKVGNVETPNQRTGRPLSGLSLLDVGCGGGILSEPLVRLGATVTGIDASAENIEMAKYHANLDPVIQRSVTYKCVPVEELAQADEQFDGVVASEIIEHVADTVGFVSACCSLVKPGGSIFFTTINKTVMSRALAVYAAENILNIVPKGAHDWEKFISPEDLQVLLTQNNFSARLVHGMILNPCTFKWSWIGDTNMNYAIHATKNADGASYSD